MKKNISFVIVIIFVITTIFLLGHNVPKTALQDIKQVKLAGITLGVDLATTPEAKTQGLSGRASLEDDKGMLFVFDRPAKYSFWMKDMHFPLDIIWIGEDMHVIYIKKNALPELYPETYGPNDNAKYVLEVNSGFSQKNNLKVGDSVEFL